MGYPIFLPSAPRFGLLKVSNGSMVLDSESVVALAVRQPNDCHVFQVLCTTLQLLQALQSVLSTLEL